MSREFHLYDLRVTVVEIQGRVGLRPAGWRLL